MRVIIPIRYFTDEGTTMDDLGLSASASRIVREQIFYTIDSIVDNGDGTTTIYSGGEPFVSDMRAAEIDSRIQEQNFIHSKN